MSIQDAANVLATHIESEKASALIFIRQGETDGPSVFITKPDHILVATMAMAFDQDERLLSAAVQALGLVRKMGENRGSAAFAPVIFHGEGAVQ